MTQLQALCPTRRARTALAAGIAALAASAAQSSTALSPPRDTFADIMSSGTSSAFAMARAGCSFFCRAEIQTGTFSAFAQGRDERGVLPVKSMAYARGSPGHASLHVRAEGTQAYESRSSAEITLTQDIEFFCPVDPRTGVCGLSFQQLDLPFALELDGQNKGNSVTGIQMSFQPLDAFGAPLGINRLVVPGNTDGNTWETSLVDRLRVTVTPAISTRYRMTAKLGVSAAYIGNPGGSDWQTAPESFADMSNSAKLRFHFPVGMWVRGPGGFYESVTSPVPEPGSWALLLAGLLALPGLARRRGGPPGHARVAPAPPQ